MASLPSTVCGGFSGDRGSCGKPCSTPSPQTPPPQTWLTESSPGGSHPHRGLGVKGCHPIFQARQLRGEDEAVNNMHNFSSGTCPGSHTGQSLSPKRQATCPGKPSLAPPSQAQESDPSSCSWGGEREDSLFVSGTVYVPGTALTGRALFSASPLWCPEDWYQEPPHCTNEK